jgi:hypothetical protein
MGSTDDILLKMIKGISFFKGKYYLLTSLNAPYDYSFYKEYYLDALADPVKRIIIGKNPAIKENPPGKYLGTLLMHSTNDAKRSDLFGLPKERIIIGYPKLRDEWLEYLKDYKIAWNDEILEKEKHVVSILVKNPEVYFFDKTNSCKKFLKEIIVATRKHYKDSLIVIKPKPTKYGKKAVWLGDVLKKINDNRIIVNYIPNPFLARKTLLVFLVGRTSAYFDYVINEIPCIEHINYCEDALKIYKRGSCLPDYGVRRTSTMDELEKAVLEAKKGTFKVMSKAKLRKITAHTDSKDVFNGL